MATLSSELPAARKPSTVAGPTNGPASALASSPTRLTCPEIAATTGSVRAGRQAGPWPPRPTGRGSQRPSRLAQRARPPDDPATGQDRQGEPDRAAEEGLDQQQDDHRQRRGCAARSGGRRSPARPGRPAPSPRPAARSARCGTARRTRPRRADRPVASHRPRTPSQRAANSRNASSSVRLAPETAVRWVSPVAANSVLAAPAVRPEVSPTHQRRHQRPRLGRSRRPIPAARAGPVSTSRSGAAAARRARAGPGRGARRRRRSRGPGLQPGQHGHPAPDRQLRPPAPISADPTTTSPGARTCQAVPAASDSVITARTVA